MGLMAIDQYGRTIHGIDEDRPRASLLEELGAKSCSKIYVDQSSGNSVHIGYKVGGNWYRLFKVSPWER